MCYALWWAWSVVQSLKLYLVYHAVTPIALFGLSCRSRHKKLSGLQSSIYKTQYGLSCSGTKRYMVGHAVSCLWTWNRMCSAVQCCCLRGCIVLQLNRACMCAEQWTLNNERPRVYLLTSLFIRFCCFLHRLKTFKAGKLYLQLK